MRLLRPELPPVALGEKFPGVLGILWVGTLLGSLQTLDEQIKLLVLLFESYQL